MPKKQLSEEEKYKAKVRKDFKFAKDVDNEKVINYMWKREDAKRLKKIEEGIGKLMEKRGHEKKEFKSFKGQEEVFTGKVFSKKGGREAKSSIDGGDNTSHLGFWRGVNPPGGKPKTLPNRSGSEYKLKRI